MARNIKVTLDWKGPYGSSASIVGRAGIYMVIAGKQSGGEWDPVTYKLLDIGQLGEAAERLASPAREATWEQNKPEDSTLLFKFAEMPSKDCDETDRRSVWCCLRASHIPLPCGVECGQGYNQDDLVTINNKARFKPLRERYTCAPKPSSNP